jgi:uncharacterized protein YkwD
MIRIALTLAVALIPLAALPAAAAAAAGLSGSERALIRRVNDVRSEHGLTRLKPSRALARAADRHSHDMLRGDFFDHDSSDGTPFDHRVRRYTDAQTLGETLAAISLRRGGAATVVRMWMESPPHRAIVLDGGFGRIGIARRWGTLGGAEQSVVTADFASRR